IILEHIGPQGRLLGLDQDPDAISYLEEVLKPAASNLTLYHGNFSRLDEIQAELGWGAVNGIFLDLGVSSYQLDKSNRGFSFLRDERLDMRMDPGSGEPASALVNQLPEKDLADLLFRYGEERNSRRIARNIIRARKKAPITSSWELAEVVRKSFPKPKGRKRIHPATRTFLALRLAVNKELDHLERFLAMAPKLLKVGGRLVVISFHSLEDRFVKRALTPPNRVRNGQPALVALYKKPVRPTAEEIALNPRARSAKLRAGQRV
ncbi:MAG: 16S rRNA (cytosine(1402)-N(4))-methyltransferase RsmH, partial [Deltaproteobacteria bacterium]|nr:16S rRNA (cytosine(1402)-N(4))-methyltransferase RsmH [Deltaproteobacteria bacterium]